MGVCVKIDKTSDKIPVKNRLNASEKRLNAFKFNQFKNIEFWPIDNFRTHIHSVN